MKRWKMAFIIIISSAQELIGEKNALKAQFFFFMIPISLSEKKFFTVFS